MKKIGQCLGTNISRSAKVISFNFDMKSSVRICNAENIQYKFGLVVLDICKAEVSNFKIPVNTK